MELKKRLVISNFQTETQSQSLLETIYTQWVEDFGTGLVLIMVCNLPPFCVLSLYIFVMPAKCSLVLHFEQSFLFFEQSLLYNG